MLPKFIQLASQHKRTIVLPEGNSIRILEAANYCDQNEIAKIILVGDKLEIKQHLSELKLSLGNIKILDPKKFEGINQYAAQLIEICPKKKYTTQEAIDQCKHPLYFANLLVRNNLADGCVSGVNHTTGDVIRAALQVINTKSKEERLSSFFIMINDSLPGPVIFSDCAINISPNAQQLCDIAFQSSKNIKMLLGFEPKIAMLSFSTNGSSNNKEVEKVIEATQLLKKQHPSLSVIGDIQFDAAISKEVLKIKWPESDFEAPANIFIFPNLEAGNIAYKVAEQLGQAKAIGPILQGLNKPVNDLSRGATVDSIINTIAVTTLQVTD